MRGPKRKTFVVWSRTYPLAPQIIKLTQDGKTQVEIARVLGKSRAVIHWIFTRYAELRNGRSYRQTKAEKTARRRKRLITALGKLNPPRSLVKNYGGAYFLLLHDFCHEKNLAFQLVLNEAAVKSYSANGTSSQSLVNKHRVTIQGKSCLLRYVSEPKPIRNSKTRYWIFHLSKFAYAQSYDYLLGISSSGVVMLVPWDKLARQPTSAISIPSSPFIYKRTKRRPSHSRWLKYTSWPEDF